MQRLVLFASLLALPACIRPDLVTCGDLACARDQACMAGACYPRDRVDACAGRADGDSCETGDLPGGLCHDGVCAPAYCGDGVVQANEQCDGAPIATSCLDRGFYEPAGLACSDDCRFDTSACGGGQCGDGVVNGPEVCDGAAPSNVSCFALAYDYGAVGCSSICGIDAGPCGWTGFRPQQVTGLAGTALVVDITGAGGVGFAAAITTILRREAGSDAWTPETLPALADEQRIAGVWGAAPDDVWAVGTAGLVLHGDGHVWTIVPPFTTAALSAIRGRSASDIWAVGTGGEAYHFDGAAWTAVPTGVTADLLRLAVVASDDVYAVGKAATILHWDGTAWSAMANPAAPTVTLGDVIAADATHVYAVGQSGTLLACDGQSWQRIAVPWSSVLSRVLPVPSGLLVFGPPTGLPGAALIAYVSGATIVRLAPIGVAYTGAGLMPDGERVIGVGPTGAAILSNRGPMWGQTSIDDEHFDTRGVSLVSPNEAYAAGVYQPGTPNEAGRMYRYNGLVWQQLPAWPGAADALSVYARTIDDVFVGTNSSDIEHWTGDGWEAFTSPLFETYGIASAPLAADAFAAGLGGIAHFDGATWTSVVENETFNAIQVFPAGQVIAVGRGEVAMFDASLSGSISPLPSATTEYRGVWGASPQDVWAVGDAGRIDHYDGTAWTHVDLGIPENITAISGTAANDVWLTTSFGAIYHHDGAVWTPFRARFDATGTPVFVGVAASPHEILFGAKQGRTDALIRF